MRSDVLVLCYHSVSDAWPAPLAVGERQLHDHLSLLADRGYVGATFYDAVTDPPAARTVAVTFDDGYMSMLTKAAPALAAVGFPGTVFVATAFAESGAPLNWTGIESWQSTEHASELGSMSWDELRTLAGAGWEIGSHTRTHPRLPECTDSELGDELRGSREELEAALDRPCLTLGYPYGAHDDRVVAAAGAAGYEVAGTLPVRLGGSDRLRWPRVGIYRADDVNRFKAKVSPTLRGLRSSSAWERLRHLRVPGARRSTS